MRKRSNLWITLLIILVFTWLLKYFFGGASNGTVVIETDIRFQTISGWSATAQTGEFECRASWPHYRDELLNRAVNELGLNRIRLEIRSGAENPVDYTSQFLDGEIDFAGWFDHWYETINDNNDPNSINPDGFQFTELDYVVTNTILPLKQLLEANGEELFINLNFVDFQDQGDSDTFYYDEAEEYAELIEATFLHLDTTYGLVPDSLEVVLEPDNTTGWSPAAVAEAIVAAGKRLEIHGYMPGFVVPSTKRMDRAVTWYDEIVAVPGTRQYISQLSYHRYGGVSERSLRAIAARGASLGMGTAMLEHIGSGHEELHQDLKLGNASAWQQFALAFCDGDTGANLFWIDDTDPENPQVLIGSRTQFLRQYFKFIRSGAVRIEATTSNRDLDPVGFVNEDGRVVVVVSAAAGGEFEIQGLPAANYGINFTTENQYDVDLTDVMVATGQNLSAKIPRAGVITIYARPAATGTESAPIVLIP